MTRLPLVTVSAQVSVPADAAWRYFTEPTSITEWNFASPDWWCPRAQNDVRPGGTFSYRMESRDGAMGFDYEGTFVAVEPHRRLHLALGPDREVIVEFEPNAAGTEVRQSFTPEGEFPVEYQQAGWQAIMDNYRVHVEGRVAQGE